MLKKSQVLKEGYRNGLETAIRAIESRLGGKKGKRFLKESAEGGERVFIAKNTEVWRVVDDWKNGEDPDTTEYWGPQCDDIEFSTPEEFIKELQENVSATIEKDSIWVDGDSEYGRITVDFIGDKDAIDLSNTHLEAWKAGKAKAYAYTFQFEVSMVQKDTADILINEFGWRE